MHHPTMIERTSLQAAAGLLLVLLAANCENGTAPERPEPTGVPPTAIVSDPTGTEELAARTGASAGAADPVTYVSFPPGTFSTSGQGGALTVLNQRTMPRSRRVFRRVDWTRFHFRRSQETPWHSPSTRRGAVNRIHHRGAGREAPNGGAH
jgi:hypothetical protein